ncbi:S-adenosyl-L-methionine-dependent methyltransferase [Zopfochytrium polystomum]|nr:S-adenosyl-L-methionine-dependent methyltransferase [Zopfochytrium polystomum]
MHSGGDDAEIHFQSGLKLGENTNDPVSAVTAIVSDLGISSDTIADYSCMVAALARAEEAERPDGILNDTFARPLLGDSGAAMGRIMLRDNMSAEVQMSIVRHRLFDDAIAAAPLAVAQAVILGAGLDSRGYRLPRMAACRRVFEVDGNAAIAAYKARRLAVLAAAPLAAHHHVVVADLAGDEWHRELVRLGFDPLVATVWVAEGLLPYLSATVEERVLDTIDRLSAPGSQILGDRWGTGQFKVGAVAGAGRELEWTLSNSDEKRRAFGEMVGWKGEALLVRDEEAVYSGTKWDEMVFARFKVAKEAVVVGPWVMEQFTKVVSANTAKEATAGAESEVEGVSHGILS